MKIKSILLALLLSFQLQAQNNDLSLLTAYLDMKDALISNKTDDASKAATSFANAITATKTANDTDPVSIAWKQHKDNMLKQANTIASGKDIEKQRAAFAELSVSYWQIIKLTSTGETLYYDYCPMKKSYWISADEGIKNPYYGSKMLTCGKVAEKVN